jgi:hypothetical protein
MEDPKLGILRRSSGADRVLLVPVYQAAFVPLGRGSWEGQDVSGHRPPQTTKRFRINVSSGALEEVFGYGRMITSCATHVMAHGKILSGDLWDDGIAVTELADGSKAEWPGPFGDPQTNQNAVTDKGGVQLVPIHEITEKDVK